MRRNWHTYIVNTKTDAGRAIVEQGRRLLEASDELDDDRYENLLKSTGITARNARELQTIGRRLDPLLRHHPDMKLPMRIRTLTALSDLSRAALTKAAEAGKITPATTERDAHNMRGGNGTTEPSIIRPSDNWSFSRLRWPRIDDEAGHGYIPGDLYANCLWYYGRAGDTVLDPMAGSGMLYHVWLNQHDWNQGVDLKLDINMADLSPRGRYRDRIDRCDLLAEQPREKADYIIIDPPYFGAAREQYSRKKNDLANMDPKDWNEAMAAVAAQCRKMQTAGGRCTIIIPNHRDLITGSRTMFPEIVTRTFRKAGYRVYDKTYASRRSQQRQDRQIAILNNRARQKRLPLTDIAEVVTLETTYLRRRPKPQRDERPHPATRRRRET